MKLRECPFCGNAAEVFEPDADRNVVGCRLGHVKMRSAEAWNTRTVDPLITQLGEALETLLNGLPVFPATDEPKTRISAHHLGLLAVGQINDAREALSRYQEVKPK